MVRQSDAVSYFCRSQKVSMMYKVVSSDITWLTLDRMLYISSSEKQSKNWLIQIASQLSPCSAGAISFRVGNRFSVFRISVGKPWILSAPFALNIPLHHTYLSGQINDGDIYLWVAIHTTKRKFPVFPPTSIRCFVSLEKTISSALSKEWSL